MFVQMIEYQTKDPAAVQRLHDEWRQSTEGKRSARRMLLARDHTDGARFCELVFFDSYEEAMANSELPETDRFAERFREAVDGEVTFSDLDVVREERL